MRLIPIAAALIATALTAQSAHAGLAGDTVTGVYYYDDLSTVYQSFPGQIVSPLAVFTFATGTPNTTVTVSDTQIILTFDATGSFSAAPFNGMVITDTSFANITDVTLDGSTDVSGFSDFSFTANSVTINLQGVNVPDGTQRIVLDVNAVPEPVSMAILGSGLLGLALARRRRG